MGVCQYRRGKRDALVGVLARGEGDPGAQIDSSVILELKWELASENLLGRWLPRWMDAGGRAKGRVDVAVEHP